jgi:hypothetical protein
MGECTKKKGAADARAARKAKNAAQSVEDPASADPPSSDNNLPTRSSTKNSKITSRVLSSATKQAAQSVEEPASTDHTLSDKKLPTQSNTKNAKKRGSAAPHVPSVASTHCSTRSHVISSTLGSGTKCALAMDYDDEIKDTRPERSATIAAKALLEQLQLSEHEDTNFDEEPPTDGGSNDDSETNMKIKLDDGTTDGDDDDNSDGNGDGDGDGNGNGNGSKIEVVEDVNLKIKQGLVALAKATQEDLSNTNEEESDGSEEGESTC